MKQKIQFFIATIMILVGGVSLLYVLIDVFFASLLFMMKNPVNSLLIILFLVLSGIVIDKRFFKD